MSRCTPSRETSGPEVAPFPIILSISSINIIPSCSAFSTASRMTSSISMSLSASSWVSILLASFTLILRSFFCFGSIPPKRSFMFMSTPIANSASLCGVDCSTSTSTVSSSCSPCVSSRISASRLERCSCVSCCVSAVLCSSPSLFPAFKSIWNGFCGGLCFFCSGIKSSTSLSCAALSAASLTPSSRLRLQRRIDVSTRSRIIESTSRPT